MAASLTLSPVNPVCTGALRPALPCCPLYPSAVPFLCLFSEKGNSKPPPENREARAGALWECLILGPGGGTPSGRLMSTIWGTMMRSCFMACSDRLAPLGAKRGRERVGAALSDGWA